MAEINYRTINTFSTIPVSVNGVLQVDRPYLGLNTSGTFHKEVSKLYYKKITQKWLHDDLKSLLALVKKNKEGKIEFIKSYSDYDTSKLDILESNEIEQRIKYLKEHLITRKSVKKIIKKFLEKNKEYSWTTIHKAHKELKRTIRKYYEKVVEKALQ